MFSDAISSISWRWRPSSPLIAAAISGSAWSSVAVKNESGAEAVLAPVGEGLMDEISPPPQPVRRGAVGHGWRSEAALAGYHIGPRWPSGCGAGRSFMQDMVGDGVVASLPSGRRRRPPLPLAGRGRGWGSPGTVLVATPPLPDPPPQGGREQESALASPSPYFANRYAPPFSTLRWNGGRACMRDSHALKFGYGASLSNTFAISPTKLI